MIPVDISNRSPEEQERIKKDYERLKKQGYTGSRRLKNARQERFCQEYLKDLKGGPAAYRAGYAESSMYQTSNNLLGDAKVLMRIRYLMDKRAEETEINQNRVVDELGLIAFSNVLDFVDITKNKIYLKESLRDEESELYEKARAISAISTTSGGVEKVEVRLWDKLQALGMLMKHLGIHDPETLHIQLEKLALQKAKEAPETLVEIADDGFIDALQAAAKSLEEPPFDIETGDEDDKKDE